MAEKDEGLNIEVVKKISPPFPGFDKKGLKEAGVGEVFPAANGYFSQFFELIEEKEISVAVCAVTDKVPYLSDERGSGRPLQISHVLKFLKDNADTNVLDKTGVGNYFYCIIGRNKKDNSPIVCCVHLIWDKVKKYWLLGADAISAGPIWPGRKIIMRQG